jgi:hypothetical protein
MDHPADYPQATLSASGGVLVPGPDPRLGFAGRIAARLPRWTSPALVLAGFAACAGYALASNPTDADAAASPTCLVKLTTGFDCPGCGGTRAFWYLLHGDLPAAARSHLFAVFAAPFLVYFYLVWAVKAVTGRQLPPLRISGSAMAVFVGAWAVWSVLRNLPWAPFTWFFV